MKVAKSQRRREADRRRPVRQPVRAGGRPAADAPPRKRRPGADLRPARTAPATGPIQRPGTRPARPKTASQAKARAKARKAKAPKVVRPPLRERLRERLLIRLSSIELNPRALIARVPFVVLVIAALGVGLAVTLWLSTGAAERSYQLGHARQTNQGLMQQKEALERDVLEAQAAPALAEAARNLGMIPSRDTAHLVQDATGNWTVVGTPKPAEGVPPPPLNVPLPEDVPPPPAAPAARVPGAAPGVIPGRPAPRVVDPRELSVRMPGTVHPGVQVPPGPVPAPGLAPAPALSPVPPAEAVPPAAAAPPAAVESPAPPAQVGLPAPPAAVLAAPAPALPAPEVAEAAPPAAPAPAAVVPAPAQPPLAGVPTPAGPVEQFAAPAAPVAPALAPVA